MEVEVKQETDKTVFVLTGRLDAKNAKDVEQSIVSKLDLTKGTSIDFSEVDYISSAGLRVLLVVSKKITPKGHKLNLFGVQPQIKEILDMSGFCSIFTVHEA